MGAPILDLWWPLPSWVSSRRGFNSDIRMKDPNDNVDQPHGMLLRAEHYKTRDDDSELMTKAEVARLIRKTPRTVEKWMRDGVLPHMKIGASVLFSRLVVLSHLKQRFGVIHKAHEVAD